MSQRILEVRIAQNLFRKAKRGWLCSRFCKLVKVKVDSHDLPAAKGADSRTFRLKVPNDDRRRGMWHHELKSYEYTLASRSL